MNRSKVELSSVAQLYYECPYDSTNVMLMCYCSGHSKPILKDLQKVVIPKVSIRWYELGIELFDEADRVKLQEIKETHNELQKCCLEMFQLWLNIYLDGTWHKIIEALKSPGVQLMTQANNIEKYLISQ